MKKKRKTILRVLYSLISLFLIIVTIIFSAFNSYANSVINSSSVNDFTKHDGYLSFDEIPPYIINAFVCIEDETFWTNNGYNLKSMARGIYVSVSSGGDNIQGGSTITQQLIKNTYLTQEQSIVRKVKELFIAVKFNDKYTKKQIMEFYINNCYYANNCYTIESASLLYFGLKPADLTLSQSAYLCAIPNSPTAFNPLKNPKAAIKRRDLILEKMLERGCITQKEYNEAIAEEITINTSDIPTTK